MTYTFFEDPGHGWLEVPFSELEMLGLTDAISYYSYRFGDKCYLEEDCDMAIFLNAVGVLTPDDCRNFFAQYVTEVYQDDPTPIRNYQSYRSE